MFISYPPAGPLSNWRGNDINRHKGYFNVTVHDIVLHGNGGTADNARARIAPVVFTNGDGTASLLFDIEHVGKMNLLLPSAVKLGARLTEAAAEGLDLAYQNGVAIDFS